MYFSRAATFSSLAAGPLFSSTLSNDTRVKLFTIIFKKKLFRYILMQVDWKCKKTTFTRFGLHVWLIFVIEHAMYKFMKPLDHTAGHNEMQRTKQYLQCRIFSQVVFFTLTGRRWLASWFSCTILGSSVSKTKILFQVIILKWYASWFPSWPNPGPGTDC